ncbi:MAG: hypothetical protein J7L89_03900, partial [Bacteroidales bacterium]|nr:hypothetical protein [Bacteroidales bacterium]
MKNKHLLFAVTLVFMTGLTAFSQVNSSVSPELTGDGDRVVKKLDPMNAANWISARRVNQYTGTIDLADILRAQEQVKALQRKGGNSLDISWTEMGPNNIGGRTRTLLIDKDNTSVLFAGGVSGGLWKSTTSGSSWEKVATTTGDLFANMAISAIAQTANGDIYFGTGEGMASSFGSNQNEHNGVMGQGIWKSTDHGNTFERLTSTWSTPESMATFVMVNDLSADPTDGNRLYAATANGVMMTTDGGASWVNPIPEATDSACDVQAGPDGTVIACVGGIAYLSPNGDPGTFVQISEPKGVENGKIDDKDVVRMKFAFAPSDPNYIYCLAVGTSFSGSKVTGHPLSNVYQSTDKGQTWKVIGPGGSNYFQPISNTGDFSVAMAVDPSNPDFIMLGGRNLFSWSYVTGWEMITIDEPTQLANRGFYVHRDQHVIAFDPANTDNIYVGTSGGIAVTNDKGLTWRTLNRNYNVTQFLTVAYSPTGELLGGTVDNGILYIDFQGNDPMYAQWWGGNIFSSFLQFRNGGDCEISTLDPSFKFYTTPGGTIHRRMIIEDQISYQTYYGTGGGGAWLSPMCLWESYNDPLSWDTVLFIADRDYAAGETIVAESLIKKYPLTYTLEEPLAIGDTVKVQDTYQASLAFGKGGKASVKMNRHPLSGKDKYRNQTYTILDRNTRIGAKDNTIEVEFSSDAYYLFAATWDDSDQHYKIYRVSNLQNARDRSTTDTYTGFDPITGEITYVEVTEEIGHFDQVVTSLRVDPTNNDNVIATLGNYGNESNIYLCTTATTAADSSMAFVSIQGNLPQAPVYDVLFNWRDHKEVIVATEYGVYSTSDVFANPVVWASENHNGMEIVPVFQLRQQKFENSAEFGVENHGVI